MYTNLEPPTSEDHGSDDESGSKSSHEESLDLTKLGRSERQLKERRIRKSLLVKILEVRRYMLRRYSIVLWLEILLMKKVEINAELCKEKVESSFRGRPRYLGFEDSRGMDLSRNTGD
jgi:hypothetical protein